MNRRLLLTLTLLVLSSLALAEEPVTDPQDEPSWWVTMLMDWVAAFVDWVSSLSGALIEAMIQALPANLQTDITPYIADIQVLNAWLPLDYSSSVFMLWLGWCALYAGIRWTVRIVRGG